MNQIMKEFAAALLLALEACGQAGESVEVKYRGKVSLQGFECTDTQSSFVHRICYAEPDKYLLVWQHSCAQFAVAADCHAPSLQASGG